MYELQQLPAGHACKLCISILAPDVLSVTVCAFRLLFFPFFFWYPPLPLRSDPTSLPQDASMDRFRPREISRTTLRQRPTGPRCL